MWPKQDRNMVKVSGKKKKRKGEERERSMSEGDGGCDGGRMPPCQRMRKKDLVLTKTKEQKHCKPLPRGVLCQSPVAACCFHPSSLPFTCSSCHFPSLSSPLSSPFCSHLPPPAWAASGRFLIWESSRAFYFNF